MIPSLQPVASLAALGFVAASTAVSVLAPSAAPVSGEPEAAASVS